MELLDLDFTGVPGFTESEATAFVDTTTVQEESDRSFVAEVVLPTSAILVAAAGYCYVHYRRNKTCPTETK